VKTLNLIAGLSIICLSGLQAQSKKITIETKGEILWAGVDRPGDLFLILKTGEVQKFNNQGQLLGTHGFRTPPAALDPMDGVQSFYYLQEENLHGNLSADLSTASQHPLDPAFAISPWLVCPSLHELWILDSADHSIKKTNLNTTAIAFETTLKYAPNKSIQDYRYMREYQNYLFLLDKNEGIHLFNTVGKFIRTIGEKNLECFGFLGEEVYYSRGNTLILVDIISDEKRTLPLPVPCRFALLTDNTLYAVATNTVAILDFKP
jgi:hypothetical protein